MKKRIAMLTSTILALCVLTSACLAEHAFWDCENCGNKGSTENFCVKCGTKAPDEWQCPQCGREGNADNYCGSCGTKSPLLQANEVHVGDVITYGHYEQDNDPSNGAELIEWIVLDYYADKGQALLISKYGLDARQFYDGIWYPTWEKSHVRDWLNSVFINRAFTAIEQQGIQTATVITPPYNNHNGGNDTQDKIWLLSVDEVKQYFGITASRRAEATSYAMSRGAVTDTESYCTWWLRSPGSGDGDTTNINCDGLPVDGYIRDSDAVIRPAIILDLKTKAALTWRCQQCGQEGNYGKCCSTCGTDSPIQETESETEKSSFTLSSGIQVGNVINFGHYEQDDYETNGAESIEWIVLDYDEDKNEALLVSKYGLETKQFHNEELFPTWEKSDLRDWLNGEFISTAFSDAEQKALVKTNIHTEDNTVWEGVAPKYEPLSGGNDTEDIAFLLSIDEVLKYEGVSNIDEIMKYPQREIGEPFSYSSNLLYVQPTEYSVKGLDKNYLTGCCTWWLRTPSIIPGFASTITDYGVLQGTFVNNTDIFVRPAIWLNLGAL